MYLQEMTKAVVICICICAIYVEYIVRYSDMRGDSANPSHFLVAFPLTKTLYLAPYTLGPEEVFCAAWRNQMNAFKDLQLEKLVS